MNSLILCEGNTDAILLSYYLNKVYGHNTSGASGGIGDSYVGVDIGKSI